MLSRVLTDDQAQAVSRVVWQRSGATVLAQPQPSAPSVAAPFIPPSKTAPAPPPTPDPIPKESPAGSEELDRERTQTAHWRQKAEQLEANLHQAEQTLVKTRQASYQEGWNEGHKAAAGQLRAEVDEAVSELARTTANLHSTRTRVLRESETDVVKLAIAISRRLLHRELTIDPEAITALVRVGLDRLRGQQVDRLRLFPEHAPAIRRLLASQAGGSEIAIVEDSSLSRGGAVFETTRGNLDVSLETQLEEVQRGLTDRLRN